MEIFSSAKPYPFSKETLRILLEQGHKIYYLTARPPKALKVSEDWLTHHNYPHGKLISAQEKAKACEFIGADVLFEDMPIFIDQFKESITNL